MDLQWTIKLKDSNSLTLFPDSKHAKRFQTLVTLVGSTQRRTFRNILQWAWNLPGLRELACHRITAFPGKLKGVLHCQEDGTNIFPASCITWVNYVRFITYIHNFIKCSKIGQNSKKNFAASRRWFSFYKKFFKKSPSRCILFCQQDKKLDQFSQQNTHCRTAILQKSSLGAPT